MLISIIIPLYNKGKKVCRSIDSVLRQDYHNFEVIVVDDGSTDNSSEYVKTFLDDRIVYVYQKNAGVSSARNTGIANAHGEWFYFLDADDEIEVNALSSFVNLHNRYPDVKFLIGNSKWMQNGVELSHIQNKSHSFYTSRTPYFDIWINRYRPGIRNILVHRSLVELYGGFDTRMSFFEDWEFPLRMLSCGKVAVTSDVIGIYNQEGDGLSGALHPVEKEMAYYTPELLTNASFWKKCLLYSNIEQTKNYWSSTSNTVKLYNDMQKKEFSGIFGLIHSIRQKIHNMNWI